MKRITIFLVSISIFLISGLSAFAEDFLNNPSYIAQTGYGATKESAENAALAAISKFFQMNIEVKAEERTTVTSAGANSTMTEEVFVNSQTELFAVHYTKPRFDKKQKQYEVTAYIDREEAWRIYEPKIEDSVQSFEQFYSNAISQSDNLSKIIGLSRASKEAKQSELIKKLDFAMILNSDRAEKYGGTRNKISDIEAAIRKIAKSSSVSVKVSSDYEDRVSKSVKEIFSKIGIKTLNENAEYLCSVEISENTQTLPAGIFFTPSFAIQIEKAGEVIYSVSRQLKKIGAKNEAVAKQRAFSAVAEEIQKSLQSELAF